MKQLRASLASTITKYKRFEDDVQT